MTSSRSCLKVCLLSLAAFLFSISCLYAASKKYETFTDPASAGKSFAMQGEYVGKVRTLVGEVQYGAQIIALGNNKYDIVGFPGGLPGAGWDRRDRIEADGKLVDGKLTFDIPAYEVRAIIDDGKLKVVDEDGLSLGVLDKVERKSPTLGAKPPCDAIVLFDGTSADNFVNGRIVDDNLLAVGTQSKQKFGDHRLHLEFRTPFMPTAREQARGNSGCYVQGRYEVQILDSFGLEGKDNECGGIYKISVPAVNMCLPPLSWQTYDIDFTSPKYKDGQKVQNARITVKHNGVVIHDDVELPGPTPKGLSPEGPEPEALFLQDHSNPVHFRNIWVVPK